MASLEAAYAAVARGDCDHALALLDALDEPAASSEATLLLRGKAAYGAGDLEATLRAWEALHDLRLADDDRAGAAWAASMVALHLLMDTGLMSTVRGWLRRAERLVAELPEPVAAHAVVAMVVGYERFFCGDPAGAEEHARRAVELGERFDVPPAVVVGRTAIGRLRILAGEVEEGLALLDEVAAHLMTGKVDPLATGIMYCELICAVQALGLHERAREWTEVMERWQRGAAHGGVHGRCRVHRAELLRLSGPGDLAEQEALQACAELRPWLRREYGWPLVELGTIRLHRGDLEGAEEAFAAAHRHVWSPEPGLALLRLAQGHVGVALTLITEAVARPATTPSKEQPPFGDLRLAPLLAAQVEIAAAAGEVAVADRAATRLSEVARDHAETAGLCAAASLARGRVDLLRGDSDEAVAACTAAATAWAELGAPYEAACVRIVLGRALHRSGRPAQARSEWEAARADFAAFGAALRVAEVDRLLEDTAAEPPALGPADRSEVVTGVPDAPVSAVFALVGGCRRIWHGGVEAVVPDLKGFRYLALLLAAPGREFHALDLVALEHGGASGPTLAGAVPHAADDRLAVSSGEAGLPMIDDQARAAYRRRLREVEEDIEDARAMDDLGRLDLAERDRDYLLAELGSALGLGGRVRTSGGSAERARTSVTRSLRYALDRLAAHHPDLGAHLSRAVRTGVYCSYQPDPVAPITWDLRAGASPGEPRP